MLYAAAGTRWCIHACPTILDYDGRNVGTRREVFKLASFTSITDICSRSNAATFLGVGLDHVMMLMAETAIEIWDDLKLRTFLISNNATVLQPSFPEF